MSTADWNSHERISKLMSAIPTDSAFIKSFAVEGYKMGKKISLNVSGESKFVY